MFSKKEYSYLIISSIVLGFIFSFSQWGYDQFNILIGIRNFLISFLLSLIFLLAREFIRKAVAKKIGFETEFKLWYVKQKSSKSNGIPIGVIASLLLVFITNGQFIFAAVSKFDFKNYSKKDLKRRYEYIRGIEEAIIASIGALVPTFMVLIFNLFNIEKAVFIGTMLAIYSIVPLPSQDGIKMYFGSISYYILVSLFVIFSLVLVKTMGVLATLIISIILALLIALSVFYQLNK